MHQNTPARIHIRLQHRDIRLVQFLGGKVKNHKAVILCQIGPFGKVLGVLGLVDHRYTGFLIRVKYRRDNIQHHLLGIN